MNNPIRDLLVQLSSLPLLDAACKLKQAHTAFIKDLVNHGLMAEEEAIAEANRILNIVNEGTDILNDMRKEGINISSDNKNDVIKEIHERLKEKGVINE